MVLLKTRSERLEHTKCIVLARFLDGDRLKPPIHCAVTTDAFVVLLSCRCTDDADLTARQCGFEQICRIGTAFCRTGSHQHVKLIDEENGNPLLCLTERKRGFQPLLKFPAVFCACKHGSEVKCINQGAAQDVRDITV